MSLLDLHSITNKNEIASIHGSNLSVCILGE